MATTYIENETMCAINCANCSILFAIPEHFMTARRNDHASFYCPSGHSNFYRGKSEKEQLKEELQREQQRTNQERAWRQQAEGNLRSQKLKTTAERAAKTRLKNRIKNGVCPCCNRSFANLRNHIAHKHPEFKKLEGVILKK